MNPIGGGIAKNITHKHFIYAAITLLIIVGGSWAWHYYKIRHAVKAEQEVQRLQFQAERGAQERARR